jgi:N-acetylglucosaminyl-diphospho-decaprenol L-rhamnosyltransferase
MTSSHTRITIILVTFESAEKIAAAVASVPHGVRAILVDNASRDETINEAVKAKPDVEIHALDQNIGFGRANNIGLKLTTTDYVLLQNPDAILGVGALEKAVEIFDANPTIGALGIGHKKFNDTQLADTKVIGGAMFFRMKTLHEVGFFDEKLFLYAEDSEICWRILKAGYRVCRSNEINIDHVGGSSVGLKDINHLKHVLHGQSLAYFEIKKYGQFLGGLSIFVKAHRSLPFAFFNKNKYIQKKARRDGVMSYLKNGEKILFDNELAKRRNTQ